MALETGTYISDLVSTNPTVSDNISQGDDHIRLLKATIKATFPNITGAVTSTQAELNKLTGVTASTAEINKLAGLTATTTELNYASGVTSSIQTQLNSKGPGFPAGTLMLFQQTSAPTGWTKQTTHNDKALRVVSGTASSGGSTAFTSVFTSRTPSGSISSVTSTGTVGSTTLAESQIPSHKHNQSHFSTGTATAAAATSGAGIASARNATPINNGILTQATGGGGSHNHSLTMNAHSHTFTGTALDFSVQYVDLIIAQKD